MAHPALIDAMTRQPGFRRLLDTLPEPGAQTRLAGLPGSAPALLTAALAEARENRVWVVVAPDPAAAESAEADLHALLGADQVSLYPQRESLPYESEEHHVEISGMRVEALEALLAGRARVLVTTVRAIQELAPIPRRLTDLRLSVAAGDTVRPRELADRLESLGFERSPLVEAVGQYAVRGGIIDLFGFGAPEPLRLEFWGDEITSIRAFDILDQRSTREVERADVLPIDFRAANRASAAADDADPRSLLDALPRDALLLELAPDAVEPELERTWSELLGMHEAERRRGGRPLPPDRLFLDPDRAQAARHRFGRLTLHSGGAADVRFQASRPEAIDRDMERLAVVLRSAAARGEETLILCDNDGQIERLEELLDGSAGAPGLPPRTRVALGTIAEGFVLEGGDPPMRVLTDHEIFRRARRLRRGRRFRGAVSLESLAQLQPGDYVVHLDHGVGRFRGLEHVSIGDDEIEVLGIEYAGGETLRVPIYRLDLIERWVAGRDDGDAPKLHKIGGKSWKKLRRKTEREIRETATELLELYAAREMADGHAFSSDTRWQKEMESGFLYEDTPDQRQATLDVKRDMESERPMDRLLCGDVGYGKTEVAIRAAFKAVQDGKQVAVLAPTTILAEQHLRTFRERLADYPVRIEALSRLRAGREQQSTLADTASGGVDILIGTHRILGADIVFDDLGLLIIDEEQRFGVRHKEKLKELKRNIDVLALTATPIPRTLHLSLAGLRDLSLIQTPPRDRMPVITHVLPWIDEVLEDAIRRELDRGGQVFVVHNRVQTIHAVADRVRTLVPDARIGIAHGQLGGAELDDVMRRFLAREIRVLVTTTIIENGIDVPSANTLIVDRADQFGLSQLYQLRGRVGRSHHRAYCYLVVPDHATREAEKRLRILEHHTELGSGYAIALKDLELRGAGNLLGHAQSGFVHAVGLETYTRLLENTVRSLRQHEDGVHHPPPDVSLPGAAYLPDDYVPEPSQKLHLYRRLSRLERPGQVDELREELRDRFGPPPPEVERVLAGAALRLLGQPLGAARILLRDGEARVNFREGVVPRMSRLERALHDQQLDVEVRRTMPLSLVLRRYGARPLETTLVEAFALLLDERARAA